MKKENLKIWFFMSAIGILGVLSMLLPNPITANLESQSSGISPTLRLLSLVTPTIFVIVLAFIGSITYNKVGFKIPIIENLLNISDEGYKLSKIFTTALLLGVCAGVVIVLLGKVATPYLSVESPHAEHFEPTPSLLYGLIPKLLYGGVVEEIMMRFGFMTLIVWILFKVTKSVDIWVFWVANILAALLFALGHFPALMSMVASPTLFLYAYILINNVVAGLLFGYAYMKKGLECAMIAHMITHLTMIALAYIMY